MQTWLDQLPKVPRIRSKPVQRPDVCIAVRVALSSEVWPGPSLELCLHSETAKTTSRTRTGPQRTLGTTWFRRP
jgi:hypothetical protein